MSVDLIPDLNSGIQNDSEPASMEDTIRAAMHDIHGRTQGDSEETTGQAADKKQASSQATRDTTGRFAATASDQIADQNQQTTEPVITPPVKAAPSSWSKESQDRFSGLDPKIQEEVLKREADFHKGIDAYRTKAQFAESIEKTLMPYMATIQSLNISPEAAIGELLKADHILRHGSPAQKAGYMQNLMQQYGVDMRLATQQAQMDPNLAHLHQGYEQLLGRLNGYESQQQKREQAELHSQIAQFSKDKPHFEAVRNDMSALLQSGMAQTLDEAYEKATYANPAIRAQILAQQQEETDAKRAEEVKKKTAEARRSGSINVPKRGTLPTAQAVGPMEDTIRAKAQSLGMI